MDYTSVSNIMKVIRPLFLDELEEEFEKIIEGDILPKTKIERLQKLWVRISKIKIFDPACGSGNFLIITYKKLRELENNIIESLNDLSVSGISVKVDSQIKLENFFGIEIDDFAYELAILSLYIAAHQMNIEFEKKFGKKLSIIPLKDNPKIVCANAARIDWQDVCPNSPRKPEKRAEQSAMFDFGEPTQENLLDKIEEWDEIYLIGNPPYKGSKNKARIKNQISRTISKMENIQKTLIILRFGLLRVLDIFLIRRQSSHLFQLILLHRANMSRRCFQKYSTKVSKLGLLTLHSSGVIMPRTMPV